MMILIIGWIVILLSVWNIFKWYYAEAMIRREFADLARDLVVSDKSKEALMWAYRFISGSYYPSELKKVFSYTSLKRYFGFTDTSLEVDPEVRWLIKNHPDAFYRIGILIAKVSYLVHPIYTFMLLFFMLRKVRKNNSSNLDGSQFLEILAHAH